MATKTLKVEFLPDARSLEVTSAPEVHDISYETSGDAVPTVLENPHVDFPGTWTLVGEGEGGTYQYTRAAAVADDVNSSVG